MERSQIEAMRCFDASEYKNNYPDLSYFSDDQLFNHFYQHGLKEGRHGRNIALRENLVKGFGSKVSCLEIGPFLNPVVQGKNVKYFDVLDKNGLIERAARIGYPTGSIKNIDFVSDLGDLSIVNENFDRIISAHCIEHQPDIIKHLRQVERILNFNGIYFLIIPDKRFCFDNLIAESTIAEMIEANQTQRSVHLLRSVIEHRALTTHNDSLRHWDGDHADAGLNESVAPRILGAIAEFHAAKGDYIDVHAWQFTPFSFFNCVTLMRKVGLINLEIQFVCNTAFGRNEFIAALVKL